MRVVPLRLLESPRFESPGFEFRSIKLGSIELEHEPQSAGLVVFIELVDELVRDKFADRTR